MTGQQVHTSIRSKAGFTLVELIIVIAVISILLSIATFAFHDWQVKSNVESQVTRMATDFNELRVRAMTIKQRHSITINPNSYVFKSYSSDDESISAGKVIPGGTHSVSYGLKKQSALFGGEIFEIDQRGMLVGSTATIYLDTSGYASLDCLKLDIVQVNVGKKNATGDNCDDR